MSGDKRVVWKYAIPVRANVMWHRMPKGATIVAVGMDPASPDGHVVAIWADVAVPSSTGQPGFTDDRRFLVTGTGMPVPDDATYLGLALDQPGYAWHVWETPPP